MLTLFFIFILFDKELCLFLGGNAQYPTSAYEFDGKHDFVFTHLHLSLCLLSHIETIHDAAGSPLLTLCAVNILAQGCVYGGESQCDSVCVKSPHHTQGSEEKKRTLDCELHPGIQSKNYRRDGSGSNMFSATLRPYQLCNARNSI